MLDRDLVLAVVPKIGASLSIPCSLFIISESIRDHRQGKGTAIQRALVGMSFVDVCASFAWWLSNWGVPRDSGPYATGTVASCNFQGFLLQFAVGAPLYNCSLSLYYVLVIKYNWTNQQLVKIERYVHAFILTFIMGTSIAGLPLTMYNRVGAVCWVIGSPVDCENSGAFPEPDIPCDRGNWAWAFGLFTFYTPLWICVLLTIVAMCMIYFQVRSTFGKLKGYAMGHGNASESTNINLSSAVENSSSLYPSSPSAAPRRRSTIGLSSRRSSLNSIQECESERNTGPQPDTPKKDSTAEASHLQTTSTSEPQQKQEESLKRSSSLPDMRDRTLPEGSAANLSKASAYDDSSFSIPTTIQEEVGHSGMSTSPVRHATFSIDSKLVDNHNKDDAGHTPDSENTSRIAPADSKAPGPLQRLRNRRRTQQQQRATKLSIFATQAILYSGSFFITWTPSTIWSVAHWFKVSSFWLDLASASFEPLQGVFNILIFVRRRPSSQKKIKALFQNLTCCCRMGIKAVQTSIAVRRSSYNSQVLETSMQAEVSQAIVPSEASSSHNNYDKSVNLESYEADA